MITQRLSPRMAFCRTVMITPFDTIMAGFGLSPAEGAILLTVAYEIPLPREQFISHAIWEVLEEVTEDQASEAFDACLEKGWIYQTVNGIPEFTEQGSQLWIKIRNTLRELSDDRRANNAQSQRLI